MKRFQARTSRYLLFLFLFFSDRLFPLLCFAFSSYPFFCFVNFLNANMRMSVSIYMNSKNAFRDNCKCFSHLHGMNTTSGIIYLRETDTQRLSDTEAKAERGRGRLKEQKAGSSVWIRIETEKKKNKISLYTLVYMKFVYNIRYFSEHARMKRKASILDPSCNTFDLIILGRSKKVWFVEVILFYFCYLHLMISENGAFTLALYFSFIRIDIHSDDKVLWHDVMREKRLM